VCSWQGGDTERLPLGSLLHSLDWQRATSNAGEGATGRVLEAYKANGTRAEVDDVLVCMSRLCFKSATAVQNQGRWKG